MPLLARPAEKTKAWYEYREIFLNEKRVEDRAVQFYAGARGIHWSEPRKKTTGVPAEIIVAIIGVETLLRAGLLAATGLSMRSLRLRLITPVDLTVLYQGVEALPDFDASDQGMDPLALKGSYAGAMGYGQFMPSSYRSYAIDFDGDDKASISGTTR